MLIGNTKIENISVYPVTADVVLRFLLVKRIKDNIIPRLLYGFLGEVKNVKKEKESLHIETKTNSQLKSLLRVERSCILP